MKNSEGKSNRNKIQVLIIAVFVLLCGVAAALLYWPREGSAVAVISVDGAEYRRIDLASAADGVFSIAQDTGKPVSFEVRGGKIRFVDVTCPDHVCEKAGWCEAPGQRAVCLPNRTALVCYRADELADKNA